MRKLLRLSLLLGLITVRSIDAFGNTCRGTSTCVQNILDRRAFVLMPTVVATSLIVGGPTARAAFGDSSRMEFPNYIEFLIEKNKVADPGSFLYKGADPEVVLQRLLTAQQKLQDIPKLADEKKWSQVQGVLTGPLGTLGETLSLIAKDAKPEVQAASKKVKADVFRIGQAASKKDGAGCTGGVVQASQDLETFVKVAFEG